MNIPWNAERVEIIVTKHFALKYMRKWGWDFHDLRDGLREAYAVEKMGKIKYEVYINKGGFKKMIIAFDSAENKMVCISGSEGGLKK